MNQPTRRRVFLSFAHDDLNQVRGLRLLASNPDYDLEFYDESVKVAMDSDDAEYVKRQIREKISRSSVTVCLVGLSTHASEWVDWELRESVQRGNTIITMALKGVDSAVVPAVAKQLKVTLWEWDPAFLRSLIAGG
jgi:hypothetical protein